MLQLKPEVCELGGPFPVGGGRGGERCSTVPSSTMQKKRMAACSATGRYPSRVCKTKMCKYNPLTTKKTFLTLFLVQLCCPTTLLILL